MLLTDGTLLQDLTDEGIELIEVETDFAPKATPGHFLMFATGATNIPTVGFDPKPCISFVHNNTKTIPSAQTCSNMLYLYVNKSTLEGSSNEWKHI